MSSLIDVAFLLLIYFLVSTSLERDEADMSLTLPGSTSVAPSKAVKVDQMNIRIDQNSIVFVNDSPVESPLSMRNMSGLNEALERYAVATKMSGSRGLVIIDCHDDAQEQRFIDVLNAVNGAGLKDISLKN